jgi:diguanylate cyclase (GGDEF)-like protein
MRHWVASTGAFVADDNGVIIMAHDSALEGMALPHARATRLSTAQRMDDYRRPNFAELGITSLAGRMKVEAPWVLPAAAAQMVEIPGAAGPLLYTSRSGVNSGLSAHLAEPLHVWPDLQRKHRDVQLIAFALMVGVGLIAYLIATSYRREKLHLRAARRLASQLQASNALLSAEARDDALTGALSRRYFLSLLQKEIDDARASGEPLVLAIADLDHFKQINDRFGHPTGDCALEHFVALCRFELRTSDAIGRLGGEEFGILLTSTALAEGVAVAERVRERVKTRRSPRLPAEVTISTSIGMTALSEGDTVERLLARADRALYAAKSAGRDRTQALTHDDAEPVETAT